MRPSAAFSIACLLVLPLHAEQAWQSKPYADWTVREARQVLMDSPWSKQTAGRLSVPPGFSAPPHTGTLGDGVHGSIGGTIGTYGTRGVDGEVGAGTREPSAPAATVSTPVTVRWESALPVRQAEIKLTQDPQPAGEPVYVIAVLGLPREIGMYSPEDFRSRAFLRIKGKKKIPADGVKIVMPDDKPVVLLFFPKTTEITTDTKEVEITLSGVLDLRQKFAPKEMVYLGDLEL